MPNVGNSKPETRNPNPGMLNAGPPASGKGTQCEKIVEGFNVVHISTGDELRYQVKQGTALGTKAKYYMDNGMLVSFSSGCCSGYICNGLACVLDPEPDT